MLFLQVRLAKEAREFAVVAMQKEPQDDLAQHLMGNLGIPLLRRLNNHEPPTFDPSFGIAPSTGEFA